jgi:hypothetical protein
MVDKVRAVDLSLWSKSMNNKTDLDLSFQSNGTLANTIGLSSTIYLSPCEPSEYGSISKMGIKKFHPPV